jgi:hypothetical protein
MFREWLQVNPGQTTPGKYQLSISPKGDSGKNFGGVVIGTFPDPDYGPYEYQLLFSVQDERILLTDEGLVLIEAPLGKRGTTRLGQRACEQARPRLPANPDDIGDAVLSAILTQVFSKRVVNSKPYDRGYTGSCPSWYTLDDDYP